MKYKTINYSLFTLFRNLVYWMELLLRKANHKLLIECRNHCSVNKSKVKRQSSPKICEIKCKITSSWLIKLVYIKFRKFLVVNKILNQLHDLWHHMMGILTSCRILYAKVLCKFATHLINTHLTLLFPASNIDNGYYNIKSELYEKIATEKPRYAPSIKAATSSKQRTFRFYYHTFWGGEPWPIQLPRYLWKFIALTRG